MSGSHREERHVWTSEMPNLQSTARRRRTAAAAHEGSRSERRAALRRPLSTLWCVCSFRRCDGERNGVQRVGLPRARTSAKRSAPRPDRAPESARLAGRPRLSTVDDRSDDSGGRPPAPNMRFQLCPKIESACRPAAGILSGIRARFRAFENLAPTERPSVRHSIVGRLDGRVADL